MLQLIYNILAFFCTYSSLYIFGAIPVRVTDSYNQYLLIKLLNSMGWATFLLGPLLAEFIISGIRLNWPRYYPLINIVHFFRLLMLIDNIELNHVYNKEFTEAQLKFILDYCLYTQEYHPATRARLIHEKSVLLEDLLHSKLKYENEELKLKKQLIEPPVEYCTKTEDWNLKNTKELEVKILKTWLPALIVKQQPKELIFQESQLSNLSKLKPSQVKVLKDSYLFFNGSEGAKKEVYKYLMNIDPKGILGLKYLSLKGLHQSLKVNSGDSILKENFFKTYEDFIITYLTKYEKTQFILHRKSTRDSKTVIQDLLNQRGLKHDDLIKVKCQIPSTNSHEVLRLCLKSKVACEIFNLPYDQKKRHYISLTPGLINTKNYLKRKKNDLVITQEVPHSKIQGKTVHNLIQIASYVKGFLRDKTFLLVIMSLYLIVQYLIKGSEKLNDLSTRFWYDPEYLNYPVFHSGFLIIAKIYNNCAPTQGVLGLSLQAFNFLDFYYGNLGYKYLGNWCDKPFNYLNFLTSSSYSEFGAYYLGKSILTQFRSLSIEHLMYTDETPKSIILSLKDSLTQSRNSFLNILFLLIKISLSQNMLKDEQVLSPRLNLQIDLNSRFNKVTNLTIDLLCNFLMNVYVLVINNIHMSCCVF